MKYMLLIYDNADTRERFLSPDGKALGEEIDALMAELDASGELVGGEALADPAQTVRSRGQDAAAVVTDGPLAELTIWTAAAHDGGRGSPIGGDAPGQEQRCSAGISSEASSRAFRSKPGRAL
jgi:hypothetical protein